MTGTTYQAKLQEKMGFVGALPGRQ